MSKMAVQEQSSKQEPKNEQESTSEQEQTTASMLMQSTGGAASVTGKAVSTVSVLYLVNYMTTFGVSIVEFMPKLLAGDTNFLSSFNGKQIGNWRSYALLGFCLAGGVGFSWFGNFAKRPNLIKQVESYMYGNKATTKVVMAKS